MSRRPTTRHDELSDEELIEMARTRGPHKQWARWACEEWDLDYNVKSN
ncbi:hypothetical protein KJ910_02930 [Patescibacteria group bacterium]|nr:hypothetical protein [Patescibacteria group bacterium]MBU1907071.1 hypothetical protein [Patescibacteria group bacterium]